MVQPRNYRLGLQHLCTTCSVPIACRKPWRIGSSGKVAALRSLNAGGACRGEIVVKLALEEQPSFSSASTCFARGTDDLPTLSELTDERRERSVKELRIINDMGDMVSSILSIEILQDKTRQEFLRKTGNCVEVTDDDTSSQ